MNSFSPLYCVVMVLGLASAAFAGEARCTRCGMPPAPRGAHVCTSDEDEQPSWIFARSLYTHDPYTGARVAQYQRLPSIEPLEDERLVTSRYRRTQTNLRGTDGSFDSYYEVQAWGNGRGGIDAEWERFHNAWKDSYIQGSYYNQSPGYGNGFPNRWNQWNGGWGGGGWNGGWGGGGWNGGWNGGWGGPGVGGPGWGGPPGGGFPGLGNSGPWRKSGPRGNDFQGGAAQYNGHGQPGDWN